MSDRQLDAILFFAALFGLIAGAAATLWGLGVQP
jgi:hypothetical protein